MDASLFLKADESGILTESYSISIRSLKRPIARPVAIRLKQSGVHLDAGDAAAVPITTLSIRLRL
jgi:hypothetical protein